MWLIGCYVAKVTSQVAMCQELFYDNFTFKTEIQTMGLYSFIRHNVFFDRLTGKYIFRGREFKRNGQAQKAARDAYVKENRA